MRERVDDIQEVRTAELTLRGPWEDPSTGIDTIPSYENEARGDLSLVDGPSDERRDGPATFSAPSTRSAFRAKHVESFSRWYTGERDSSRNLVGVPGIEYDGGTYLLKERKVFERLRSIESPVGNHLDYSSEVSQMSSSLDLILAARSECLSEEVRSAGNGSLDSILQVDDDTVESHCSESTGRERDRTVLPSHKDLSESRGLPVPSSFEESNAKGIGGEERCEQNTTEQCDDIRCESIENNASETVLDESNKSTRVTEKFTDADPFDYLIVESIWRAPRSESHDPFDDVLVFTTCFDNELEQVAIRDALDSINKRLPVLPTFAAVDAEGEASGSNNVDNSYIDLVPERVWSDDPFDEIFYFTTDFDFEVDQQEVREALQSISSNLKKDDVYRSKLVVAHQPHGITEPSGEVADALGTNCEKIKKHDNNNPARTSVQSDCADLELCDKLVSCEAQFPHELGTPQESSSLSSQPLPTVINFKKPDLNHQAQQSDSTRLEDALNTATDSRRINFDDADINVRGDGITAEANLQAEVQNSGFNDDLVDGLTQENLGHCRLVSPLSRVSQQTLSDTVQSRKVILGKCGQFDPIYIGVQSELALSVRTGEEVKALNQMATSAQVDTDSIQSRESSESHHIGSSPADVPPERVWSVDPFDEVFYFTTDFDFEIDQNQIQEALHSITTRIQEVKIYRVPLMGGDSRDHRLDGLYRDKSDVQDAMSNPGVGLTPLDGLIHSIQFDGGIGAGLSLRQEDDLSKLSRFWNYLEDALVDASMTPESESDDSEVQVLAQESDEMSTTTLANDFDGTRCVTSN